MQHVIIDRAAPSRRDVLCALVAPIANKGRTKRFGPDRSIRGRAGEAENSDDAAWRRE